MRRGARPPAEECEVGRRGRGASTAGGGRPHASGSSPPTARARRPRPWPARPSAPGGGRRRPPRRPASPEGARPGRGATITSGREPPAGVPEPRRAPGGQGAAEEHEGRQEEADGALHEDRAGPRGTRRGRRRGGARSPTSVKVARRWRARRRSAAGRDRPAARSRATRPMLAKTRRRSSRARRRRRGAARSAARRRIAAAASSADASRALAAVTSPCGRETAAANQNQSGGFSGVGLAVHVRTRRSAVSEHLARHLSVARLVRRPEVAGRERRRDDGQHGHREEQRVGEARVGRGLGHGPPEIPRCRPRANGPFAG